MQTHTYKHTRKIDGHTRLTSEFLNYADRETDLSVSPDGAPTVGEQLGHVVVAAELPQTGFQVEVPVEAECAVPPERAAELIRRRLSHAVGAARRRGDEAVARGDLLVVQQVGAAVVSDPGSVGTERQLEVHERPG